MYKQATDGAPIQKLAAKSKPKPAPATSKNI
jgi:hypothetical protein